MKTNKSYTKRLRVTRTGKVLARKQGFNHYNAKQKRAKQLRGKKPVSFGMTRKEHMRFLVGIKQR